MERGRGCGPFCVEKLWELGCSEPLRLAHKLLHDLVVPPRWTEVGYRGGKPLIDDPGRGGQLPRVNKPAPSSEPQVCERHRLADGLLKGLGLRPALEMPNVRKDAHLFLTVQNGSVKLPARAGVGEPSEDPADPEQPPGGRGVPLPLPGSQRKESMSKKMIVLALAAVSAALFAMPAVASAQSWHLDTTTTFSVSGAGGTLTSTAGLTITCAGTSGSGTFSTTTEGTVSLLFSGCKEAFSLPCTTAGQASGAVKLTARFDAIMVSTTAEKKQGCFSHRTAVLNPHRG
jgi:hypothetical protein